MHEQNRIRLAALVLQKGFGVAVPRNQTRRRRDDAGTGIQPGMDSRIRPRRQLRERFVRDTARFHRVA